MGFEIPAESNLENLYVDDAWMIERFTGASLWVAGDNIGDNTLVGKSTFTQTISGGTNWKEAASSTSDTNLEVNTAIKTDGTLWSWGNNNVGQLGVATIIQSSSPVQVLTGGNNWKSVSTGSGTSYNHTAAIKTDGTLWLWGGNIVGALGNNSYSAVSSPVQTIAGGTNWKQVSAGNQYTAAIKTDGTLWSWGNNSNGQLADNTVTNRSSPVQTIAGGTNWKQVSAGIVNGGAIKTDGTLWLWGNNSYGQIGNNSLSHNSSPIQTVAGGTNWKQVSIGSGHTAAIKTDGTLWTWGYNANGQLGDNSVVHKSSPVQTIAGGTNWKQLSAGYRTTAVIKTDGTLWLWGNNSYGQLADNTLTHRSSPVQSAAGGTNWHQVAAGNNSTVAITINSN